jgi:threonylcarbamoyladenosine tRNA methylthiotransferase MtaB
VVIERLQPGARSIATAAITNLGCKVNQSEMDAAARLLRERGIRIVDDHVAADLYLINTCTVTAIADQKSRQAVRRARRGNPDAEVVVTGCSVQVDPSAFEAADPAARLIGNDAKDALLRELATLAAVPERPVGPLPLAMPTLSGVEPGTAAVEGGAPISIDDVADNRTVADRTRAFVKVQDGCSFYCTYCIIPRARGAERSLAPATVLEDVRRAIAAGHREVVLTGINIGTYDGGHSERGPRGAHRTSLLTLAGLVRRILAETDVERLRISSIEPQHVDDELIEAWLAGAPRTLPHFHLPLQSGDDGVLRRMGRRYDSGFYRSLVGRLRSEIMGVAIHADVIVGFPSEDDAAWARSLAFIRSLELAGIHVFRYSVRPGTAAMRMTGHVDDAAKKRRAAELLALAAEARACRAAGRLGSTARVLFETRLPDGRWLGHAEDHVLVAARLDDQGSLENAIGAVRMVAIDPTNPDHVQAEVLAVDWPRRPLRAALPMAPGHAVQSFGGAA